RVRTLTALEDGSGVLASVEMQKDTKPYLTDKLKFWLVKPNVGFSGISGLDTLLSGAYIQVDGSEEVKTGNSTRYFKALVGAPPVDIASGLLVYKLVTSNASGVNKGALIYHRNILVGAVHDVQLSNDNQSVEITIAIEPTFKGLVKRASRFWSVSGIQATIDMSGVKVQSNGLVPLLIGGVAFSSPPKSAAADEFSLFRLYANADAARDSLEVRLTFSPGADIKVGSGIYLNSQKVGVIDSLDWEGNFEYLSAKAKLSMEMVPLMKADTQFWLDTPALSMDDMSVGKFIQGTVIRMIPGTGGSRSEFEVLEQSPNKRWAQSGLHLNLTSKDAYGLSKNSLIYYQSQKIGEIQWVDFDPANKLFTLDALIYPKYEKMLGQDTAFYNSSGIHFNADLLGAKRGVKISVPSVGQMISGGIGVHLGAQSEHTPLTQKSKLKLYKNLEAALSISNPEQADFYLQSKDLLSPVINSPVYYKQFEIGRVSAVTLAKNASHSTITLTIKDQFKTLIRQNSLFWMKPALDIRASIHGVQVQAAPLMSMLSGGIELSTIDAATPAASLPAKKGTTFTLFKNADVTEQPGQLITLTINKDTTLKVGAPVKYRGFEVGKVTTVKLLPDLSGVEARVELDGGYYQHFNRDDTIYWLVQPKLGLNGIKNVAATVFGDSLAVNKGHGSEQTHFVVSKSNLNNIKGLAIVLEAAQLGSLSEGDPVLYKQLRVGEVTQTDLSQDSTKLLIDAVIYPQYRHLVSVGSKFWNASGVKVDVGLFSGVQIDTQTLESIVAGGISFATLFVGEKVDGEEAGGEQVVPGHLFILHQKSQPNWSTGVIIPIEQ
ncbi:MAG: MCE family protein, partial [Algicola sp.]|nr:MCE family protein [Algicola sp.]